MSTSYNLIKKKVEQLKRITTRPMFGYQCYSASGKFFVGFSRKNNYQVIIRLSKDQQEIAIKNKAIKPFSHGAKMGWIEINAKQITASSAMKWISKAQKNALKLSKKS